MAHVRRQICDAIKDQLLGLPITLDRVYASRVYPIDVLPAISIYWDSDTVSAEQAVTGNEVLRQIRELAIRIEVRAKAVDVLDITVDAICEHIEAAMVNDVAIGGIAHWTALQGTAMELDGEGEAPAGVATLTYLVIYRISADAPDVAID